MRPVPVPSRSWFGGSLGKVLGKFLGKVLAQCLTKEAPLSRSLFQVLLSPVLLSSGRYRLRPEPGPVGVNVDPLGEGRAPTVLPDGLMVLGPFMPFEPVPDWPAALPVVVPLVDEPVVVPLVAEPPAVELPAEPPAWASANVLDSASAPANAMVISFMVASFRG
jgi:hypothetical protein